MKTLLLLAALAAEPDLDALVERFYLGAKATLAENAACLESDQQAWQRALKVCRNDECLKRARLARLAELQALQESVPSGLDLPEVPQLLWAIGPATEAKAGGTPLKVEGRLEYRGGTTCAATAAKPPCWSMIYRCAGRAPSSCRRSATRAAMPVSWRAERRPKTAISTPNPASFSMCCRDL